MTNRTFTMIKPDAMRNGHAGAILDKIIKAGFRVVALKQTKLSLEKAGEFYAVHKERPFYGELTQFMSSGIIIAAILEKDNAVADFRTLIGATDPAKADEGTIRKEFATSLGENAVHGSDSDENAKIEGDFFFSGLEQFNDSITYLLYLFHHLPYHFILHRLHFVAGLAQQVDHTFFTR
ncbi:MAG: nucleoside-diphosphate kinase [Chitinophagaceae bacterium]|nr:MAG: nucleoside-diphosphate kinase [Chitinophagaceae bacterium]